jgi:aminopeptidase N
MGNAINFHAADGSGYEFLASQVMQLDSANPQIAARLLSGLIRWKRYDQDRQSKMKAQLERVLNMPTLSSGCNEIASKGLA